MNRTASIGSCVGPDVINRRGRSPGDGWDGDMSERSGAVVSHSVLGDLWRREATASEPLFSTRTDHSVALRQTRSAHTPGQRRQNGRLLSVPPGSRGACVTRASWRYHSTRLFANASCTMRESVTVALRSDPCGRKIPTDPVGRAPRPPFGASMSRSFVDHADLPLGREKCDLAVALRSGPRLHLSHAAGLAYRPDRDRRPQVQTSGRLSRG